MPKLILPSNDLKRIIRRRRLMGGDRHDEVWNGVYVMSPIADNEHMALVGDLTAGIKITATDVPGILVLPGCNVSDRPDKWNKNYRVPDVAVFLPGNPAEDRESHYLGGPDFAAEIISPGDRSRKKLTFYAKVGVRELLLVNRKPWRLELYRLQDEQLVPAGTSEATTSRPLASSVLSLTFRLIPAEPRPRIEVTRPADGTRWLA